MAYATIADFETAFGTEEAIALTNLDNPGSIGINSTILNQALADATAEADAYLQAAGYSLPLPSTPLILRNKCCDIARYRLDKNRVRDDVRQRYEDAIAFLKDLSRGLASLGLDVSNQVVIGEPDLPQWYTGDRVFHSSFLANY